MTDAPQTPTPEISAILSKLKRIGDMELPLDAQFGLGEVYADVSALATPETPPAEQIAESANCSPPAASSGQDLLTAAVNQNDAMRQELANIGNLISDLARAMHVDQANADGTWPDLAGRIRKLHEALLSAPAVQPGGDLVVVPREPTRAWASTLANMRQGQSSTPRCEPPGEYDIERAFATIKEVLAAADVMAKYAKPKAAATPQPEAEEGA